MDLTRLFVDVDDFAKRFDPQFQQRQLSDTIRRRRTRLSLSEIMTILIAFPTSNKPALSC